MKNINKILYIFTGDRTIPTSTFLKSGAKFSKFPNTWLSKVDQIHFLKVEQIFGKLTIKLI